MEEIVLKVKLVNFSNGTLHNFLFMNVNDLPNKYIQGSSVIPISMQFGKAFDRTFVTSLGPNIVQMDKGYIGMSRVLLSELKLNEFDDVMVRFLRGDVSVSSVTVQPVSSVDYRLLTHNSNLLEGVLLNQVRVAVPNQIILIKVDNILIKVKVDKINPNGDYGILQQYTEMIVLEPSQSSSSNNPLLNWSQQLFFPKATGKESMKDTLINAKQKLKKSVYRAAPDKLSNIITSNRDEFDSIHGTPCRFVKLIEKTGGKSVESVAWTGKVFGVEMKSQEILIPWELFQKYKLNIGSKIEIEKIQSTIDESQQVTTSDCSENETNLVKNLKMLKEQIFKLSDNVLIVGPIGVGKTCLINALKKNFEHENIYACYIPCKTLRGKKIEQLTKLFGEKFSKAAYRHPSVVFLDDLDSLMYNDDDDGVGIYSNRLSDLLTQFVQMFKTVRFIASCCSLSSLGSNLTCVRGPRIFEVVLHVPELTNAERMELFNSFKINFNDEILEKTHGFRAQDLIDLFSKSKLCYFQRDGNGSISIDDVNMALSDTTPLSLMGIKLFKESRNNWSDIGGLESVKKVLEEVFLWPSRYPKVFQSAPLPLQTGVLLYGAPGCGKTLLAGALASVCRMNIMTIKGPELLSKYVGASEAAVRDLFERASRAQPCLLFFDELDSFAPKRGHDSTGVTDRVVNQLLTQLDGVEGRVGVWILAATSRPDLVDPALLRPGRLDRTAYCQMPDKNDRQLILEVLSKKLPTHTTIDFQSIAERTEYFTGADLQALLYNAQIKSIKENSSRPIDQSHLEAALMETSASLSQSERERYDAIFQRFADSRLGKKRNDDILQQKLTFV